MAKTAQETFDEKVQKLWETDHEMEVEEFIESEEGKYKPETGGRVQGVSSYAEVMRRRGYTQEDIATTGPGLFDGIRIPTPTGSIVWRRRRRWPSTSGVGTPHEELDQQTVRTELCAELGRLRRENARLEQIARTERETADRLRHEREKLVNASKDVNGDLLNEIRRLRGEWQSPHHPPPPAHIAQINQLTQQVAELKKDHTAMYKRAIAAEKRAEAAEVAVPGWAARSGYGLGLGVADRFAHVCAELTGRDMVKPPVEDDIPNWEESRAERAEAQLHDLLATRNLPPTPEPFDSPAGRDCNLARADERSDVRDGRSAVASAPGVRPKHRVRPHADVNLAIEQGDWYPTPAPTSLDRFIDEVRADDAHELRTT